ncbi:hypothetical protein PVAG01_02024 [Phlyctema vagabunda]|uniref:Rhodanese domain-containing protein n=1 Tax=Phlyctema vagabunda TaxID=108571 RepID=A0ABR4PYS3_9HELO
MSTRAYTVATLPRISAGQLSEMMLSWPEPPGAEAADAATGTQATGGPPATTDASPSNVAIIDVRDDDHIGGHIRTSTHVPSSTLDYAMPGLVRKLREKQVVVFHCALSQQRGPAAALRYLRERDRLVGVASTAEKMKKNAAVEKGLQGQEEDEEEEEEVEEEQKVFVLEGGFVKWQERFGPDQKLTEAWRKEIWEDGY